ncbi:MAG: hypothetical protein LBI09_02550 [Nitrososphaerota archaeon]|nr:hypothetical protein [Nitrososphaerota archaeon]
MNIVKILGKIRATENKSNYTYNSKEKQFQSVNIAGIKSQSKIMNGDHYG